MVATKIIAVKRISDYLYVVLVTGRKRLVYTKAFKMLCASYSFSIMALRKTSM